ncbi:MAG: hypothetical protein H7Y03_04100 [Chitinophagaceae bacterium]|nr:hypothetical protein [Chitinophagaceae bacterium]
MKTTNQYQILRNTFLAAVLMTTTLFSFSALANNGGLLTNGESPVSLASFNAKQSSKTTNIEWITTKEVNANLFILQRSTDGKTFTEIAVIVTGEDSKVTKTYKYTDERTPRANATVYYRLKIVNRDGEYVYSEIKTISKDKTATIQY